MKQMPFVPTVREVTPDDARQIPGLEAAIACWTESDRLAGDWLRELNESWGNTALSMQRGEEQLGFALYGPRERLARAARYPETTSREEAVLLAYVGGDARTRRHLLTRVLRELRSRKVEVVEAIACDLHQPWHITTRFLLENGWSPARRVWRRGCPYTVLRVDLKNAVEVGGLARGLIGRVKLPVLHRPNPAPGAFTRGVSEARRLTAAGSR